MRTNLEDNGMYEIVTAAREHALNLREDIGKSSTRVEHIRLTQLALEAERLQEAIENLYTKMTAASSEE